MHVGKGEYSGEMISTVAIAVILDGFLTVGLAEHNIRGQRFSQKHHASDFIPDYIQCIIQNLFFHQSLPCVCFLGLS